MRSQKNSTGQKIGPVMMDLQGTHLSEKEKGWLNDPHVGGLILFTRNFQSSDQITALIKKVREASESPLIIAIDHEGGRVQRFRDGFTAIPAMQKLGNLADTSLPRALDSARVLGGVLATELAAIDVDISFTPVLDLSAGNTSVLGDRSFHQNPKIVAQLAGAIQQGLAMAGMSAVAKHFPGHGHVLGDSHLMLPIDPREFDEIWAKDLYPFRALIESGLKGLMPAHVIYDKVDKMQAGFSSYWLQDILRKKMHYTGAIFSDDLSMQGAACFGSPVKRAQKALTAGCDMLLVCNDHCALEEVLSSVEFVDNAASSERLQALIRQNSSNILNFREQVVAKLPRVLANF
jgi:beta-N-acetylhexosaminidase